MRRSSSRSVRRLRSRGAAAGPRSSGRSGTPFSTTPSSLGQARRTSPRSRRATAAASRTGSAASAPRSSPSRAPAKPSTTWSWPPPTAVANSRNSRQHLALRPLAGLSQQLGAELVEFPRPACPLLLVADHVAAVEEAQGERQRGETGSEQTRQHGGEIGPQGEQIAVAIDEAVELPRAKPESAATHRAPDSRGWGGSLPNSRPPAGGSPAAPPRRGGSGRSRTTAPRRRWAERRRPSRRGLRDLEAGRLACEVQWESLARHQPELRAGLVDQDLPAVDRHGAPCRRGGEEAGRPIL